MNHMQAHRRSRRVRPDRLLVWGFALLCSSTPALAVEYAIGYLAVPGSIEYVETDLVSGAREPQNTGASFGTIGLRVLLPLPGTLGPFSIAAESGFGMPAGTQAFDHRDLSRNGAAATHNLRHDGDFTSWEAAVVPVLLGLRYSRPSESVTFGGELALGAMLIGLSLERTNALWDGSDTSVLSRETARWQDFAMTLAVAAGGGLVIPATSSLDLRLTGGLLWLAEQQFTTTDAGVSPTLIYGGSTFDPGLILGGLGFYVRLGLAVSL